MPHFICPTCQRNINVEPEHLGMVVSCPLCGGQFQTPTSLVTSPAPPLSIGSSYEADDGDLWGGWWSWHTHVAGITFDNRSTGVSRQLIAQNCQAGEHITLFLEANNPHTPDATMLCRSNGEQLGYFKAEVTGDKVRTRLGQNYRYDIYVSNVTGGTYDKPNYGVNLLVFQFLDDLHEGAEGYIEETLAKEGLTPLYRPSPDLLERTEVRRIYT